MKTVKVKAVYFSATGTTKKTVIEIADAVAEELGVESSRFDFTLPDARTKPLQFNSSDLVILGTPVYAGRVPNVLLKYLESIEGGGAVSIPVVVYGNRNYDDALMELMDILENAGLHTLAAAAFIGEHAFSKILAKERPDSKDLIAARNFARKAAAKLTIFRQDALPQVTVEGTAYPYRGYYQPRDRQENPIDIRKVKPRTNQDCIDCKRCAALCPMGSISAEDVSEVPGICVKCGACMKGCPSSAKYYDDEGYLYHKRELEEIFFKRREAVFFL